MRICACVEIQRVTRESLRQRGQVWPVGCNAGVASTRSPARGRAGGAVSSLVKGVPGGGPVSSRPPSRAWSGQLEIVVEAAMTRKEGGKRRMEVVIDDGPERSGGRRGSGDEKGGFGRKDSMSCVRMDHTRTQTENGMQSVCKNTCFYTNRVGSRLVLPPCPNTKPSETGVGRARLPFHRLPFGREVGQLSSSVRSLLFDSRHRAKRRGAVCQGLALSSTRSFELPSLQSATPLFGVHCYQAARLLMLPALLQCSFLTGLSFPSHSPISPPLPSSLWILVRALPPICPIRPTTRTTLQWRVEAGGLGLGPPSTHLVTKE